MGYIAPVNMEQTAQYQLRTIQNVVQPITWERIYRVKLHEQLAKHQELDEVYRRKEQLKRQAAQDQENRAKHQAVVVSEQAKVGKRETPLLSEIQVKESLLVTLYNKGFSFYERVIVQHRK